MHRQLSRVHALRLHSDLFDDRLNLCLRQEAQRSDEADSQVAVVAVQHTQMSQLLDVRVLGLLAAMPDDDQPRSALLLADKEVGLDLLEILVDDLGPDSCQRGLLRQEQGAELLLRLLHDDAEADDVFSWWRSGCAELLGRVVMLPCCRSAREQALCR